jgi:hypothetical protein
MAAPKLAATFVVPSARQGRLLPGARAIVGVTVFNAERVQHFRGAASVATPGGSSPSADPPRVVPATNPGDVLGHETGVRSSRSAAVWRISGSANRALRVSRRCAYRPGFVRSLERDVLCSSPAFLSGMAERL